MDKKIRNEIIQAYRDRKGEFDWNGMMDYVQSLLASRDSISAKIAASAFSKEDALKAIAEKTAYLKSHPISIDADEFRANCVKLQQEFIKSGVLHDSTQLDAIAGLDWGKLSNETIALAGIDPNEFFMRAVPEVMTEVVNDLTEVVLAGLLINVVRAYLQGVGEEMTDLLAKQDDVRTSNQSSKCPTCGQQASLSSVLEGAESQGNARMLFCSCCGTVWPYERVRCAYCGTRNTNKLRYVHTEDDPAHRIHICDACGGVMPTVFQEALGMGLDYDVETTTCGLIESIWLEQGDSQEQP